MIVFFGFVRVGMATQVLDFVLTGEEMSAIDALDCKRRFNDPGVFAQYPIWD
jgi:hypothetical protein